MNGNSEISQLRINSLRSSIKYCIFHSLYS
nr:MAG TPA: hypothetical protein [Caudoviricetes sp.]